MVAQVGPFVAICTANGIVFRMDIFSLGAQGISLLQVPEMSNQSSNPRGVYGLQHSQEHQWQQQARHGREAHVRPAEASHSPIRAQVVVVAAEKSAATFGQTAPAPESRFAESPKGSQDLSWGIES